MTTSVPPGGRRSTRLGFLLPGAHLSLLLFAPLLLGTPASTEAQTLRGSAAAMELQNRVARDHDFTFLRASPDVDRFVSMGLLVRLEGNRDYRVHRVSYPYVRPEIRTFVERFAGQYRRACGEQLVVTSATRPLNRQPPNASDLSVHPTGMAVDLRRSNSVACRSWLENTLLYLEGQGVLNVIRERYPPHYHVAIFPTQYGEYVTRIASADTPEAADRYRVRPGDSLWRIAEANGVGIQELRRANRLASDRLYPGQTLILPGGGGSDQTDGAREGSTVRTASAETSRSYRVRPGDSLWGIAQAHDVSILALRAENDLSSNRIHPGQALTVPPAGTQVGSEAVLTYRVRSGDSLWTIARTHRTTVDRIQEKNQLRSTRLVAGQVLRVPLGR